MEDSDEPIRAFLEMVDAPGPRFCEAFAGWSAVVEGGSLVAIWKAEADHDVLGFVLGFLGEVFVVVLAGSSSCPMQ